MENNDDLTIVHKKTIEELVITLDYLQSVIKANLKPIAEKIGEAHKVALMLNKLDFTIHNFNDEFVAKLKMGSVDEMIFLLNEIDAKVERLGKGMNEKFQNISDRFQKEMLTLIDENVKKSYVFEENLSSMIIERVNSLDISKLERKIEADIKKRLNHFPFEEMNSLKQVLKFEELMGKKEKMYDKYILKIQEQNAEMRKIAQENKEHIGILQIKYIVVSLGFGTLLGYTNFFSFVPGLG